MRARLPAASALLGLLVATACSLGDGIGDLSTGAVSGASGAAGLGGMGGGVAGQAGGGRAGTSGSAGNAASGSAGAAGVAGATNGGAAGLAGAAGTISGAAGSGGSAGAGGASPAGAGGVASGGMGGSAGTSGGAAGSSLAGSGGASGGSAGTSGGGGAGSSGGGQGGTAICLAEIAQKSVECGMEIPDGYAEVLCAKQLCSTCLLAKSCDKIPSCQAVCKDPAEPCVDQYVDRVEQCDLPESLESFGTVVCNNPICAVCVLTSSCDDIQSCTPICNDGGN